MRTTDTAFNCLDNIEEMRGKANCYAITKNCILKTIQCFRKIMLYESYD